MLHHIEYVDELPSGLDFLFLATPDGDLVFIRASAVTPQTLQDAWAAYRALSDDRSGVLISTG